MKVIVVDDENSMLLIIKKMLSKIPEVELVGSFQSMQEAYRFIRNNRTDMAFVDIRMPDGSGLDFARRVTSEEKDITITFLTAHKEYALEAFDACAFDYIVKPVSQRRLENSIERAKRRFIYLQPGEASISPHKLSVYGFGGLEVRSEEKGTVLFGSSKSAELFAYLILRRGRAVSKWSIIEDVFGGMPARNAETYLNTTIYKLRKALEPHGMKSIVISANEGYKIEIKDVYIDIGEFESQLGAMGDINSSNVEEALKIEKLYAGELFGDKDYGWALSPKEGFSEMYWSFAKKLSHYLFSVDRLGEALQILKRMEYINELDAEVNCLLMKVYAAQKDRIALERQLERYENAMKSELGVQIEEPVINLYKALIGSFK